MPDTPTLSVEDSKVETESGGQCWSAGCLKTATRVVDFGDDEPIYRYIGYCNGCAEVHLSGDDTEDVTEVTADG